MPFLRMKAEDLCYYNFMKITPHSYKQEILAMKPVILADMVMNTFREIETKEGKTKHWHIFDPIVQK